MPSWHDFQPFIATGLALGGVYALSGVGMVVLYRTTGVLNLAFGAVGAMGALIAWDLINNSLWPEWPVICGGVLLAGGGQPALRSRARASTRRDAIHSSRRLRRSASR